MNHRRAAVCGSGLLALVLILTPNSIYAQTVTGTILGSVVDPSGGAVPNTEITITNQDTGVGRTARTNAEGLYNVPSLLAGTYMIKAEAQGFSPAQVKDVAVRVGSDTRIDLRLQVGQTTQ